MKYKNINQYYVFQTAVSLFIALAAGAMWTLYFLKAPTLHGFNAPLFWLSSSPYFFPWQYAGSNGCTTATPAKSFSCLMPLKTTTPPFISPKRTETKITVS